MGFLSRLLGNDGKELPFRDFYYIDELLLRMYFTQLPEPDQARFRDRAFAAGLKFELAAAPKIGVERYRPELPYDTRVALALFMEKALADRHAVGSLGDPRAKFCAGTFAALHANLAFPQARPIFCAYPEEGISVQLDRQGKSFLVLGEGDFCSRAWQTEPQHPLGESVFSRLLDLFGNVVAEKANDVADAGRPMSFDVRPGGGDDYLDKLLYLLETEYRPMLRRDVFHGMFVLRQPLQTRRGSLAVLYPLFIARVAGEAAPGE